MDKILVALIIAQNGLKTAATLLVGSKSKLEKQLSKAKTEEERSALQRKIEKSDKLAAALHAVDAGITDYQSEAA